MTFCYAVTKASLLRPTLLPGLIRVWRGPHTLQLGLDPERAVLLDLPDPRAAELLDLLDGEHTERAVITRAGRIGVPAVDARTLLASLRSAGLVIPAQGLLPDTFPDALRKRLAVEAEALALHGVGADVTPAQTLRRRLSARVVVAGRGRLAAPVAVALAQAGVGHVRPQLPGLARAVDLVTGIEHEAVGRPRDRVVADAIERAAPGTRTGPVGQGQPELVVQAGADRPAVLAAAGFARRGQAHLLVEVRDGTPVIGPLVRAGGRPCLNCLELHRRDRDPQWPGLAAQLATRRVTEPCSGPTVLAATALAAAEALAYLDGGLPETVGAAIEVRAPGRVRRRSWPPHPGCPCARNGRRRSL